MNRLVALLALAAVLIAGGVWMFLSRPAPVEADNYEGSLVAAINNAPSPKLKKASPSARSTATTAADKKARDASSADGIDDDTDDDSDDEPETPAEKAVKNWENVIAEFYEETEEDDAGETDEDSKPKPDAPPKPPRVTLDDQLRVRDAFRAMDEENRMEEVHHTMNLLPDESIAVIYGVLFDKTQPEEIMDVIFSDILNRDEDIKNPMMREIVKDETHPMYTESARILDVVDDE